VLHLDCRGCTSAKFLLFETQEQIERVSAPIEVHRGLTWKGRLNRISRGLFSQILFSCTQVSWTHPCSSRPASQMQWLYYSIGTKQAQVPYSIIVSSVRVSRPLRPFARVLIFARQNLLCPLAADTVPRQRDAPDSASTAYVLQRQGRLATVLRVSVVGH
jgi:hypothetical protein